MGFEDVNRSTVSAQLLTQLAVERGMTLEACLRGTGIDPVALMDSATTIAASQEMALIRNMLAALGDMPGLGLDAGLRYHLSSYGILGFALLSSPTARSAAEVAVRYLDLSYSFARYRHEHHGRDLCVIVDDTALPEDLRQFLVERDFAAWANAAWEMRPGGFRTLSAEFRFPRPSYAWRLEKLCGVRPTFGATRNALLLDASTLDSPLPQADPVMARVCEEQCRRLLDRRRMRDGLAGQVRDRLLRNPGSMPPMDDMARELHLSTRSLRRRLTDEGTSYRALTDEVRQALAEELLMSAHMKLSEVAARLGYTEPAAFINAFRRWKGVSPTAYRRARIKGTALPGAGALHSPP